MYICVCTLELQQCIDILPYHDTLGSDTVSIRIVLIYLSYCPGMDMTKARNGLENGLANGLSKFL